MKIKNFEKMKPNFFEIANYENQKSKTKQLEKKNLYFNDSDLTSPDIYCCKQK